MKAVWIAWILLITLLFFVFSNAIYIRKNAHNLITIAEQMSYSASAEKNLSSIEEIWYKQRDRIGVSVGFRELDHVDEAIDTLRWACQNANEQEFERQRILLIDAIEEIARAEQNSWKSLF